MGVLVVAAGRGGLAGLIATVAMDIIGRAIVARALGVPAPSPNTLGRWIGHMRSGRFTHPNIVAAPPIGGEAAIGILAHYVIGFMLGAAYGILARTREADPGSIPLALAYGTATTVFSWLVMFPATGQGVLGRGAHPRLPVLSLTNHIVYGLALGKTIAKLRA